MSMTLEQAAAAVTAPGQVFEITEADVLGHTSKVWKNCPPNLRAVFAAARGHGDKTFLVYEGRSGGERSESEGSGQIQGERLTFAETLAHADALAFALVNTYGVKPGDRVAIGMRNFPEWVISFIGITSIGAINVSLNSWWTADELDYGIEDSGSTVLICDRERLATCAPTLERLGVKALVVRAGDAPIPGSADRWEDVVKLGAALPDVVIAPDDDATILYTSGTTGRPKGAVSTHRAVVSALMAFGARGAVDGVRRPPAADVPALAPAFILIVPLFHVTGNVPVMLGCMLSGAKLVIMYKWDAGKALQIIQDEQITNFVGVPTQSWDLVNHPDFAKFDTSSLRAVGGGGAPAPAAQVELVSQKIKQGGPQLGYGMTETNAYGPGNNGQDYLDHPTSTGKALPIMDVVIRDDELNTLPTGERGEIWFRGPMLIRGYWGKPEATAETIVDGWLRTGDIGRFDEEGFLYIEDRAKDMILRGGENVYCAEIESAIYTHPAIHEAAVFGIPHERLGEEVAVALVLRDGVAFDADELRAHIGAKLASFKVPAHVFVRTEPLPRNAAGKFLKRQLRDEVAAEQG
jgi:long-chain acyl-CoA synthetase